MFSFDLHNSSARKVRLYYPYFEPKKTKVEIFFFFFEEAPGIGLTRKRLFLINYFNWRIIYNILMVFSILSQHESATGIHVYPDPETPLPHLPTHPVPQSRDF